METKIEIGQSLWMETKYEMQEYVISTIGTKYLEVVKKDCTWDKKKIDKTTLLYEEKNYPQNNIQFFRTKEEILEIKEQGILFKELLEVFKFHSNSKNFSLEKLKQVKELLNL